MVSIFVFNIKLLLLFNNINMEHSKAEAQKIIKGLSEKIEYYNNQYFQNNISEISDFEFDKLLAELIKLENTFPVLKLPTSPSQRVGGTISKNFETVVHKYPMLSLGNTYSKEDLIDFDERIKKTIEFDFDYVCELKFDGVAISLTYENGILVQAVTRGDGVKGDDITANAKTIRTIPLQIKSDKLPSKFEVRGEVFMPKSVFDEINAEKIDIGEAPLANPRNAASGALKLQSSAEVSKRKLDCYLYYLLGENLPTQNHSDSLTLLKESGFNVSDTFRTCKTIDDVWEFIQYWELKRLELPLDTDGIVIKVNNYRQQEELGFTAKSPRWAISFKYAAQQASTILESISYQVGRTGAITPVANLKPVLLAGTVVKRASLHNANEIERLGLQINDTVKVEKGGEIIPQVVGVDLSVRPTDAQPIVYITECPACNTSLVRKEGEANHYCPNEKACPPQIKAKFEHFIHRKAMNIDGLGPETIDLFFEKEFIKTFADLYTLQFEQVQSLKKSSSKWAQNVIDSILKSREIPFERVLFALGIRFVGATVAEKLATYFKNIDALSTATKEQLIEVPEIGERIAESVILYFSEDANNQLIEQLKQAGLQFEIVEKEVIVESNALEGNSFVVSGVFTNFSRDEIKAKIEANGGKIVSSISAKTNYVVAGENMGPSKLEKATKLGVKIISEDDFVAMLG